MIVVVDYGLGNLRSVQKSFERIGIQALVSNDAKMIEKATHLILPGVGHFEKGMKNLRTSGMLEVLNHTVLEKKVPILGICLGMQLMTSHSEEGDCEGLNWVKAKTIRFERDKSRKFKVPHIGWNSAELNKQSDIFSQIDDTSQFYFVHTYYVDCDEESDVLTKTDYRISFHSSFQKDNIIGVQFHPEKSYKAGLQLLKNFANS